MITSKSGDEDRKIVCDSKSKRLIVQHFEHPRGESSENGRPARDSTSLRLALPTLIFVIIVPAIAPGALFAARESQEADDREAADAGVVPGQCRQDVVRAGGVHEKVLRLQAHGGRRDQLAQVVKGGGGRGLALPRLQPHPVVQHPEFKPAKRWGWGKLSFGRANVGAIVVVIFLVVTQGREFLNSAQGSMIPRPSSQVK